MDGIIEFVGKSSPLYEPSYNFLLGPSLDFFDYSFRVNVDEDENYEGIFEQENVKKILESFKDSIQEYGDDRNFKEILKIMKRNKNDLIGMIKKAKYVSFDLDPQDLEKFIHNNPSLIEGKLVFTRCGLDDEEYLGVLERAFRGHTDQLMILLDGNEALVSFDECKKTIEYIDRIVDEIRSLDFSPLEAIMYTYDIVRDREYKREKDGEDLTKSRDLTAVLFGEEIVCKGYSVIVDSVLRKLGIKSMEYKLMRQDLCSNGHVRNAFYVDDGKYDVKGVYYLDATAGRREEDSVSFLQSYRFFAKTKKEIEECIPKTYIDLEFGNFGSEMVDKFEKICREKGVKKVPKNMIHVINKISSFIDGERLIPYLGFLDNDWVPEGLRCTFDLEYALERLHEFEVLLDNPIDGEVLFQVLYNVRKKQYYMNPQKYPLSIEEFLQVYLNSDWELSEDKKYNLLAKFMGWNKGVSIKHFNDFMNESGLDRDIERVELVKTLQMISNKKSKN